LDDHTAHRHPGILLHARCRLAFAWPEMVSSAARSCRALQRSFTLQLARLLFWLLCCTLKLPSFSPHPLVFTLSFLWPACLLAHFTYTIFQYGIPLNSPVFSAGFPLSPATLTGTRIFTSQPRPHPIIHLLLAGPLTVARLARPAYRSAHRIPPSKDRLHHLRAARDTLKPNSRHPVVEATAC